MARICDLRQKEVINVRDGARLGFICDLEINCETGCVEMLIIPGPAKVFGVFGYEKEYCVPWCDIVKIGEDIILVDIDCGKCLKDCV